MAKRPIVIEYEFVSTRADGENFLRYATVKADNEQSAMAVARIVGFEWFGATFTDNCIDWRIAQ